MNRKNRIKHHRTTTRNIYCPDQIITRPADFISKNNTATCPHQRIQSHHYCLEQLDTLKGMGSGSFRKQPAGDYVVVAENVQTGCRSMDTVTITAKPGPNEYALVPGCYKPEESFEVQTTGSDAGVDYSLQRIQLLQTIQHSVLHSSKHNAATRDVINRKRVLKFRRPEVMRGSIIFSIAMLR